MRSWLYGLILPRNATRVPGELSGIGDAPVRLLPCGAMTAIAASVATPPPSSDIAAVRAHDRVLRSIAAQAVTVAAVRFGQSFEDDAGLCADVSARSEEALDTLERLDGFVEMRVLLPEHAAPASPSPGDDAGPGRAYLESLRRATTVSGVSLLDALGPIVAQERVERLQATSGVVFAHLVRVTDVERYRLATTDLPALADAHVVGPLPLYSFVGPENG